LARRAAAAGVPDAEPDAAALEAFRAAMDDDLDTPRAMAIAFGEVTAANAELDADDLTGAAPHVAAVLAMAEAVGLVLVAGTEVPADVTAMVDALDAARTAKDYATADALRADLTAAGWVVESTKQGTTVRPR
jgi:cysteinyl-tRNA synthetase